MSYKIIDTHAHIILKKGFGMAGKYGPESGVDKKGVSPIWCGLFQKLQKHRVIYFYIVFLENYV